MNRGCRWRNGEGMGVDGATRGTDAAGHSSGDSQGLRSDSSRRRRRGRRGSDYHAIASYRATGGRSVVVVVAVVVAAAVGIRMI